MTDPFRHDDAAYVLGALDAADRLAFEAHLETCPDCLDRVAEMRATAGLLTGLTMADVADPEPVPDTVLPRLLRAAARERGRRRWLTASLGAVAAACLVAVAVLVWPSGGGSGTQSHTAAFTAVHPSPVTATGRLVAKSWGTAIELHCRYAGDTEGYLPYRLVVVDRSHHTTQAGSWTLTPGRVTNFTGGTAVPRDQIVEVEITLADGTPILRLNT